jgi:MYXO-CTERM domain-containing protein
MIRKGRSILAGLGLAAVMAAPASADTPWGGNGSWCGGSTFSTCFSVDLSWISAAGASITVTLKLTNTDATSGLKWFAVGMDHLPAELGNPNASPGYTGTGPDASWDEPPPDDFSGGPFVPFTASQRSNPASSPGFAQRTWTFTFTGAASRSAGEWDALLQAAGVGFHAGGVTIGGASCSTKVIVRDDLAAGSAYGVNGPDGSHPECETSPPTEITPEPMTMSLMALGLVGLGGAGFIRRRRKV